MPLRVKNWEKFQHYRSRKPTWIRLYCELLDDLRWHRLGPVESKTLVMLWILAAEDPQLKGYLPPEDEIAFRLRMSAAKLRGVISRLSHWLITDSDTLADGEPDATPEAEAEAETEGEVPTSTSTVHVEVGQVDQQQSQPILADVATREAGRLSQLLAAEMLAEKAGCHVAPDKWVTDIRRMIAVDRRSPAAIAAVILWATHDHGDDSWGGWAPNIRSGAKLRKHFDTLELAMRRARQQVDPSAEKRAKRADTTTKRLRSLAEAIAADRQVNLDDVARDLAVAAEDGVPIPGAATSWLKRCQAAGNCRVYGTGKVEWYMVAEGPRDYLPSEVAREQTAEEVRAELEADGWGVPR